MKQLTCEMCGGTDLMKQNGAFVCQNCGMKYSVEEAKKMMIEGTVDVQGTVKLDNTAFVERYLQNARRAKQKEDWPETEKYYNMVEQNDPTNIEAIFYSTFARVKQTLLEAETCDKRQSVFKILENSVSVIDDNYDNTNEEHHKLLFEIMDDINGLKKGTIVPTTHLQSYVTKNGYGNIVDRTQTVENDSLDVTFNMIDGVVEAYAETLANIIIVQCKDLSEEEIFEKAYYTLLNGYFNFALCYFNEYIKKNTESPVGYLGKAVSVSEEEEQLKYIRAAMQHSASDDKEKENLKLIIKCKDKNGFYLLFIATCGYDYDAAKYLVNIGAYINAVNPYQTTALWAVCRDTPKEANAEAARKIAKLLLDNGARIDIKNIYGVSLYNEKTDHQIAQMIKSKFPNATLGSAPASKKSGGCYVATAVYGSYDCPQVWTLRRYRDYSLAKTWYGRAFIHTYYAISPTLVKWFGHTKWFKKLWRCKLDHIVEKLKARGVEDAPYEDKNW